MVLRTPWLALSAASGVCAAFNGVFAKLTTTDLTTSWSHAISTFLHLQPSNKPIELFIRAIFFLLNLIFNGIMWALFTAALTRASSTRVTIINTSSNFILTALLGWAIFGESLPPLWWVGAACMVLGNVVIGRREEEGAKGKGQGEREGEGAAQTRLSEGYRDGQGGTSDEVEMEMDGMDVGKGERKREGEGEGKEERERER